MSRVTVDGVDSCVVTRVAAVSAQRVRGSRLTRTHAQAGPTRNGAAGREKLCVRAARASR